MRSHYKDSDVNTVIEKESLRDQCHSLTQAIEALRSPQRIYMPGVFCLLDNIDPDSVTKSSEHTKLCLPSSLPATSRDSWCMPDLPLLEFRLRYAQAVDALNEIRRLRRLYRGLILQKKKHLPPTQRTMTRSMSVFEGLNARTSRVAACYRDARVALLRLHPTGAWKRYIQELKREDTQGPCEQDTESQGVNFTPSWIWTLRAPPTPPEFPTPDNDPHNSGVITTALTSLATHDLPDDIGDEEIEEYVRVDWAKAQERAKRFEEEIALTTEDMRRTLAFFAWKAEEWERLAESRANAPNKPTDKVIQGLQAYAYRQSSMYRALTKSFVSTWYDCLHPKGLGSSWLPGYADMVVPQKRWNKIPSIIPADEIDLENNLEDISDQDADGQYNDDQDDDGPEGPSIEQCSEDVEAELHGDFINILAYG